MDRAIASPLTPTPLPPSAQADIRRLGERGFEREPSNSVPSPLEGEGQGEGASMQRSLWRHHRLHIRT
jgi:hypothetical protein